MMQLDKTSVVRKLVGDEPSFGFNTENNQIMEWVSDSNQLPPTQQEIDVAIQQAESVWDIQQLRAERNQRLANTDWWASSDLTMTAAQTAYRQALRDITNTYTSLDDVVWPEVPNE